MEMSASLGEPVVIARGGPSWILPATIALGIGLPVLGTLILFASSSGWSWVSMPVHSTQEVVGAALGLVLAVLILFSKQKPLTSRRMWIACALISMAVLDILHSCVPIGVSFVWLHSIAVLAGGICFGLVWFPERELPRGTAIATVGTVLLATALVGALSAAFPASLPAMIEAGGFTPLAQIVNMLGGGLTILGALSFAARYRKDAERDDLLFLMLCLLFGVSGVLFFMSSAWGAGWWFWHVLRFAAYIVAFWLALLSYRTSEDDMERAHTELDRLFHAAVDGKRLVDPEGNHLRLNDTFVDLSGVGRETAQRLKCHEVLRGSLCHTDECPLRQLEDGATQSIQREVVKTRRDGSEIACILKAIRLEAPDGSFKGIIESFWDITDRKAADRALEEQSAQKTGQAGLADVMRGDLGTNDLCRNIVTFMCKHLAAQTGLMYVNGGDGMLRLVSTYAHKRRSHLATEYRIGEGLVGQAALEKEEIILTNVPQDYISIESGLGQAVPRNIYVKPIVHNERVKAVIELATLDRFTDDETQFFDLVSESIAIAIESGERRTSLSETLEESQRLTEELQAQQEELRLANDELEGQSKRLILSEEKLKEQQEELQVTNEELEEKNELLERQKRDVERARQEISEKAEEAALASKYKSEFLANMSHELRTPLNSLLLLARHLSDNTEGTLTDRQVESARVIYQSGNDLLSLINEILDLSKIEAGRMDLRLTAVLLSDLADATLDAFQHVAAEKQVELTVMVEDGAPDRITTDRKRIDQVIRNLVSNALKFTEKGQVAVTFGAPPVGVELHRSSLSRDRALSISVEDTGVGIAVDKQKVIFEAFQQADGTTARKFGGTGLGLSISRELVRLLGGEIHLRSEPGQGSTFMVILPIECVPPTMLTSSEACGPMPGEPGQRGRRNESRGALRDRESAANDRRSAVADDREVIGADDQIVLIIEDDPRFACLLVEQCRHKGFKCLAAESGEEGLELARRNNPQGIVLDLKLPGMDGWEVLGALKDDPATRHIPVHVMSGEEPSGEALRRGAVGHLHKPVTQEGIDEAIKKLEDTAARRVKRVLVVEDNNDVRRGIVELIAEEQVEVNEAAGAELAIEALRSNRYDCMILDLGLWDLDGDKLLEKLDRDENIEVPPVIVYTARELTRQEERDLRAYSDSIIIKDVRSDERLLDEVSLFLHRVVADMPDRMRKVINDLHDRDATLRDKKILIVDDDMRTVFALSRLMADRGMKTIKAENGERAIALLDEHPDTNIVLMDIMMPVLDGLETMRRIRAQERYRQLPIIALTAKAMKGDQESCVAAGASDYMPKPVDQDRLLSTMRVWLSR